jgi:hypothetical protein
MKGSVPIMRLKEVDAIVVLLRVKVPVPVPLIKNALA